MDLIELKREQARLAPKVVLKDGFTELKTIGGAACAAVGQKLLAAVVVCEYPSLKLLEKKTAFLQNPLPYQPGFEAYREMPAIIEAYNQLEQGPDVLLVKGTGILHPRRLGIASHLGLALNVPTIGISEALPFGVVADGKIVVQDKTLGFVIKTKEHANPLYASPGHLVSLSAIQQIIPTTILPPHKLPEPLHLALRIARKKAQKLREMGTEKSRKEIKPAEEEVAKK